MKDILIFMLPFCQLTGSGCWEPNQSCNCFVSEFNSCKLFPILHLFFIWCDITTQSRVVFFRCLPL